MILSHEQEAIQILQANAADHLAEVQKVVEETLAAERTKTQEQLIADHETFVYKVDWITNQMVTIVEELRAQRTKLEALQKEKADALARLAKDIEKLERFKTPTKTAKRSYTPSRYYDDYEDEEYYY